MTDKNALAELAARLDRLDKGRWDLDVKDYDKAVLIIAELAKVIGCKEPERIMPLDKPYDDITIYAPRDDGLFESNSINEDEQRFILDLANAAWKCREIAEEGAGDGK